MVVIGCLNKSRFSEEVGLEGHMVRYNMREHRMWVTCRLLEKYFDGSLFHQVVPIRFPKSYQVF